MIFLKYYQFAIHTQKITPQRWGISEKSACELRDPSLFYYVDYDSKYYPLHHQMALQKLFEYANIVTALFGITSKTFPNIAVKEMYVTIVK